MVPIDTSESRYDLGLRKMAVVNRKCLAKGKEKFVEPTGVLI